MRFGEDNALGVDCNCNLFETNGLARKFNDTSNRHCAKKVKQREKISLRKSSLNPQHQRNYSQRANDEGRKLKTPQTQRSVPYMKDKVSFGNSQVAEYYRHPSNSIGKSSFATGVVEDGQKINIQIKFNESRIKTQSQQSHSPYFRNENSNYKSFKINSQTKCLVKKHTPFKDSTNYYRNLFQQGSNKKPQIATEQAQKCSLTTMAGSNNTFNPLHYHQNNERSPLITNQVREDYPYGIEKPIRMGLKSARNHPFADLLYRQAESMIGDGQNPDESQFSSVVNSCKKLEGLQLLNNVHKVNPFIRQQQGSD